MSAGSEVGEYAEGESASKVSAMSELLTTGSKDEGVVGHACSVRVWGRVQEALKQ